MGIKVGHLGIGGHHRGYRGQTDIWITPPHIIGAVGPFDLDVCAAPDPRPWPTATEHWTEGSLSREWPRGKRVWLNSPYGPAIGEWLGKLADHGDGIAICFARTETEWFHRCIWDRAHAILFLRGRLYFHYPDGRRADANAGAPSVLIAYGANNAESLSMCDIPGRIVRLLPDVHHGH